METRYIAAIEIASSKIKGAVGSVDSEGRLTVLAVEETPSYDNVRYGRVQNIREVTAAVNDIIQRLEAAPAVAPRSVCALGVSIGGRSVAGAPAKASMKFNEDCEISDQHVQRLMFDARQDLMTDQVVEVIPRAFYVNSAFVRQPVGTFGDSLRGEFLMVTCARETRQNLERIKFDSVPASAIAYILNIKAIGDFVLTPDEKVLGTAFVDVGAETTSVAVYKDGSLAFVCVIPMGSRLLTLDLIAGLGTTEEAAEKLKREIAAGGEKENETARNFMHSRAGEIIANVLNQIDIAGYPSPAISKVVLTGGGAKAPDFAEQIAAQFKMPVRKAEMPSDIAFRVAGRNNPDNIDIVALLAAAARAFNGSCLSEPVEEHRQEPKEEQPEDRTVLAAPEEEPVRRSVADEEDDDKWLRDDPDEEEEQEEDRKTTRRGFSFPWSRKRKEEPLEEDEFTVEEPEEENGKENEDEVEERPATHKLNSFRERFAKLFTPVEGLEDDDE